MDPKEEDAVRRNVEAFEAALAAGRTGELVPEPPPGVLVVLDGSDQDRSSLALAAALHRLLQTPVHLLPGKPDGAEERLLDRSLALLNERGCRAAGLIEQSSETHQRIRAALAAVGRAWIVLPCPFGHDLGELRALSLSTAVEVPLGTRQTPVLVVRGPIADVEHALTAPHALLPPEDPAAAAAALRAALALVEADPAGRLAMTALVGEADPALREPAPPDSERLSRLPPALTALVHHLADRLAAGGRRDFVLALRPPGELALERSSLGGRLQVCASPAHAEGVAPLVRELILGTLDPVLVVPAPSGR